MYGDVTDNASVGVYGDITDNASVGVYGDVTDNASVGVCVPTPAHCIDGVLNVFIRGAN